MPDKTAPVGITQLIDRIKDDLQQAQKDIPIFKIKQVELEIAFTVEDKKEGGFEIHILKAGMERANSNAQTVKIVMEMLTEAEVMALDLSPEQKVKAVESIREKITRRAIFSDDDSEP